MKRLGYETAISKLPTVQSKSNNIYWTYDKGNVLLYFIHNFNHP